MEMLGGSKTLKCWNGWEDMERFGGHGKVGRI